jgi:hypothetical protein
MPEPTKHFMFGFEHNGKRLNATGEEAGTPESDRAIEVAELSDEIEKAAKRAIACLKEQLYLPDGKAREFLSFIYEGEDCRVTISVRRENAKAR